MCLLHLVRIQKIVHVLRIGCTWRSREIYSNLFLAMVVVEMLIDLSCLCADDSITIMLIMLLVMYP